MALRSRVKEWTLFQGILVSGALAVGLGAYALGRFDPRTYFALTPPLPQTPLLRYGQMRDAYSRQDWARALALAQALLRERPGDEEPERVQALCLLNLGRFTEARDSLKTIVTRRPDDVPALLSLAIARAALGEEDLSQRTLRKIIAHPLATPGQREEARNRLFAADLVRQMNREAPPPAPAPVPLPPGEPPWMRPLPKLDRKALGLPPESPRAR